MNERQPFNPLQAQEVAQAFNASGVEYLFIGKSAAILLGYPGSKPARYYRQQEGQRTYERSSGFTPAGTVFARI